MSFSSMLLEPGNLKNFGPYTMRAMSGALTGTLAVGGPSSENDLFAVRNVSQGDTFGLQTKPMGVTRIATKFIATGLAASDRLVLRWDRVVNFSSVHSGQTSIRARCRKTTGYAQDIAVTEISGVVAGTTHMSNATYSQYDTDEPLDVIFGRSVASLADGAEATEATYDIIAESVWTPSDGLPLVLAGNEGLVCGLAEELALGSATARLFVAVDFVR